MNTVKNPKITRYTERLSRILKHLSANDRDDIVREIESHIYEKWETDSKGSFDDESLKGVLGKMGTPETIAAQYCEQRGWASPPKSHTLRNTILIIVSIIAFTTLGIVYLGTKYVINPVLNMVSGEGELVKIDDSGVKIFGGAISIGDEGVQIGSSLSFENDAVSEVDGVDTILISNANGKVEISGADIDKAEFNYSVNIKEDVKDSDLGDVLSNMKINPKIKDNTLYFEEEFDQELLKKVKSHSVDMSIKVPKKMNLIVGNKNGKIEVEDIGGSVNITNLNGWIEIEGVGGNIIASNKNGGIDVELDKNYSFTMNAETTNGWIKCDFPTEKTGNLVTAKIGDGKNSVKLETKNGIIKVGTEE